MLEIMTIGKQVTFSIYGTIDSRSSFSGTVIGTNDGRYLPLIAQAEVNHVNIYPTLPENQKELYSNLYYDYTYYTVRTDNGEVYYIGEAWIIAATLSEVLPVGCNIVLTDFDESKLTQLQLTLEQAGFNIAKLTVVK